MIVIRIWIDGIEPSSNRYLENSYHWNNYRRDKERFERLVISSCIGERPSKPLEIALVKVRYHFPDRRRRDPSNYSGKFLHDGLVAAGMIVDDDFSHIKVSYDAIFGSKRPGTEVVIYDLEGMEGDFEEAL